MGKLKLEELKGRIKAKEKKIRIILNLQDYWF